MASASRVRMIGSIALCATSLAAQDLHMEELLDLGLEGFVQVVSASKRPQAIREVAATVRVITADQIRENAYSTLEDVLADLPGFQFRNIVGFNSYAFQRGIPNQNNLMLVLVDGVQINELNSGGFYGGGQYNLANVERVEVVYGPASALYGTNAVSGIVNLITRDAERGAAVSASLGTFGTRSLDFRYGRTAADNELGLSLSGMLKQTEKADLSGAKGDGYWTDEMENFEDDVALDGKLAFRDFTLGFVFQDKSASRATNYRSDGTSYLDHDSKWHIHFFNGHLQHRYRPSDRWSLQSRLYYRDATVADNTVGYVLADTGATGGQVGYYRPNHLVGFEGLGTVSASPDLDLVIGVVRENEQLAEGFTRTYSGSPNVEPTAPPEPDMLANDLTSGFLQAQYRASAGTQLTAGTRYDHSSAYGNVTTPRLGLVHTWGRHTAKLLYAEAFRAPKPWDYTSGVGNPDLEPEEMKSIEAAASYRVTDNAHAGISVYRNVLDELLAKEEGRWVNAGHLTTHGMEAHLEYSPGQVDLYANYTYTSSELEDGVQVPEIARHSANAGITYALNHMARVSLRANYLGRRRNPKAVAATGSEHIEDAVVLHAVLSVLEWRGLDLQLVVRNLLDAEYYHTSNRPPDRYRQPQRTVGLKATYAR